MKLSLVAALLGALLLCAPVANAQSNATEARGEYRITMLRAAPGKWIELKTVIEGQGEAGAADAQGRMATYRVRHSQGAQWDFMLIQPIEGLESYFTAEVQAREAAFRAKVASLSDFEEDWIPGAESARIADQPQRHARLGDGLTMHLDSREMATAASWRSGMHDRATDILERLEAHR